MLELKEVSCTNNDEQLFRAVSLYIEKGSHIYIRGANGVGKTCFLKTLAMLRLIDHGSVSWCGRNIKTIKSEYKSLLHYLGHEHLFVPHIGILENLDFILGIFGQELVIEKALSLSNSLKLKNFLETPFYKLSAGCKQRCSILVLLLRENLNLWLLDEPHSNLDIQTSSFLLDASRQFIGNGGIILESSHATAGGLIKSSNHINLDPIEEQIIYD